MSDSSAMAILLPSTSALLSHKVSHVCISPRVSNIQVRKNIIKKVFENGNTLRHRVMTKAQTSLEAVTAESVDDQNDFGVVNLHHVGILCENLERSLDFYQNILGLKINEARPHDKLPYRGAWLWVGSEMIHLMELPNPDPYTGRPEHGGRDRHTCIAIRDVLKLKAILDKAGIPYTLSRSGRPAIFTRDPDTNALEFTQIDSP
ncbi:unnamed protein product [Lactuca saligna]|uniref:VOC domain-containing protein n=1 Tax=Lactuca saligna TaxID=75948 RepID=A0AA35Z5K0_LACSI|nr:unnamed protein product [Lactuca saligna]